MPLQSYRDLIAWQKAMDLVTECYRLTKQLPASETYGLAGQIQRSAVSVPANIAEGHGRDHLGDYLRLLSIANGSLMELETHVMIAGRLNFLEKAEIERILKQAAEVGRILAGLQRSLRATASDT